MRLAATAIACERGGRRIFANVSFALAPGELLLVEGANGAGKTSLLRLVAGFLPAASGTLLIERDGAGVDDEERGQLVGWLGHQDGAKAQLTAKESLDFYRALYGGSGNAGEALARAGLGRVAGLPCHYLSHGQKKRLALARLAANARPLWLLDEPLAGLDEEGRALALSLISAHLKTGGIALAASHETQLPEVAGTKRLRL
ncbi:MAG: heme ABC exporter ATP-binding protein CcmA [Alphaproteobacteria bacterium]|nr:heme ABC exporter ATP-binding protein CcmA [Alphaproteobacteria bacterium]